MDLQQIAQEAVKAAAQAGTVNFNFNDIHHNQNVFLGADGKVGTSAVDPNEPLSYYITDAELLRQVTATAEQRCVKADNVKKLIYDPLVAQGYTEGMLRSSEFLRALKAHLVKMPNIEVDALQRAFRENKR